MDNGPSIPSGFHSHYFFGTWPSRNSGISIEHGDLNQSYVDLPECNEQIQRFVKISMGSGTNYN